MLETKQSFIGQIITSTAPVNDNHLTQSKIYSTIKLLKIFGRDKMSLDKLNKSPKTSENICTEFKRCGGKGE
jgi:hypothetical protein